MDAKSHDGVCPVCGQPFEHSATTVAVYGNGAWMHATCAYRWQSSHPAGDGAGAAQPEPAAGGPKVPWRLLPMDAMQDVLGVLLLGANKYGPDDWRTRADIFDESWEASMRHLQRIRMGEHIDPESGLHHAAHLACRALFMISNYKERNK